MLYRLSYVGETVSANTMERATGIDLLGSTLLVSPLRPPRRAAAAVRAAPPRYSLSARLGFDSRRRGIAKNLERATGIEPATNSLEGCDSAN